MINLHLRMGRTDVSLAGETSIRYLELELESWLGLRFWPWDDPPAGHDLARREELACGD